ncbi:MAG: RNA polymerase sigma factor [Chitinophagaceae bacterium]|nr:RNA polymerase sigma factor [Chitinophagaceae bacterium]
MNQQEEAIIIQKCCKGDHVAFSVLATAYQNMAITIAYNIVTNQADAEDVAQDAFIKAYTSIKSFKGNARFLTWLYRIVVNTALNKQKRTTLIYVEQPEEHYDEAVEDSMASLKSNEQKKYIRQALLHISEAERVCIILYYLNDWSIAEIGDITGFSV